MSSKLSWEEMPDLIKSIYLCHEVGEPGNEAGESASFYLYSFVLGLVEFWGAHPDHFTLSLELLIGVLPLIRRGRAPVATSRPG
jgi:hypothetical protein